MDDFETNSMPAHMAQGARKAKRLAVKGLGRAADFLWPARSLLSDQRSPGGGALPVEDWQRLSFLTGRVCERCGVPTGLDLGEAWTCTDCRERAPPWQRARAALAYDDASRQIVLGIKRSGRRDGLSLIAGWMGEAGRDLLEEADLLVPVPLHYRRLAARGFNQAAWIAQALSKRGHVPVSLAALKRTRATPSQGHLSATARKRNMAGAFALTRDGARRVAGKRIVLVDDVLTTGATLSACTRALKQGKARQIDVLVLARVVREQGLPI